jgi:hypothetical protein
LFDDFFCVHVSSTGRIPARDRLAHLEAEEFIRGVKKMRKFIVIISSSTTEKPYVVGTFPSGNNVGSIVRHKSYSTADLKQDMKDCLGADDTGITNVLDLIVREGSWANEFTLSDECAKRLGWFD